MVKILSLNFFPEIIESLNKLLLIYRLSILLLAIYMKKLLDFDWLRAVQFKCDTSAKSETPVQITNKSKNFKTN